MPASRVEGCTIKSEDDSICLKSGVARGVDDVTIRNCHVLQSGVANSLKLGTASYGGFSNITFDSGQRVTSEVVIFILDNGTDPYRVLTWRDDIDDSPAEPRNRIVIQ